MAPSPTADAKRLIEQCRTSPAEHARHVRLEVIGLSFERPIGRQCVAAAEIATGDEITLLARTMPTFAAHCVFGTPPRHRKSELVSNPLFTGPEVPERDGAQISISMESANLVLGSTSMLVVVWIRWTR